MPRVDPKSLAELPDTVALEQHLTAWSKKADPAYALDALSHSRFAVEDIENTMSTLVAQNVPPTPLTFREICDHVVLALMVRAGEADGAMIDPGPRTDWLTKYVTESGSAERARWKGVFNAYLGAAVPSTGRGYSPNYTPAMLMVRVAMADLITALTGQRDAIDRLIRDLDSKTAAPATKTPALPMATAALRTAALKATKP